MGVMSKEKEWELKLLIGQQKVEDIKRFAETEEISTYYGENQKRAFIADAANRKNIEIVRILLDAGVSANSNHKWLSQENPVSSVIGENNDIAELLLNRGATVNKDRAVLSAVRKGRSAKEIIDNLKLLLRYGVDLNQTFEWFSTGDHITVLDHSGYPHAGRPEVHDFLIKNGAKTAKELGMGAANIVDSDRANAVVKFPKVGRQ